MNKQELREGLLGLHKEFLEEFQEREEEISNSGGVWSRKPDFKTFMSWLEKGYILNYFE